MARRLRSLCWLPSLCLGCASTEPGGPPVFGGEGAVIAAPKELPLPAQNESAQTEAGPCAAGAPKSETALLDDFEDGDNKPFKGFHREGWWYTATDNTEGGTAEPREFKAESLVQAEATKENAFAAHLRADGYKDWGVVWGTTLRWVNGGIRCALNVSAFNGLKFRAKGPGTVVVKLGTPATLPKDGGGVCDTKCYDSHAKRIVLSDSWDEYLVRFDRLQQGGWGTEARFDPSRVLDLSFAVDPKALPADFWIDDISFVALPSEAQSQASTGPAEKAP